jgi:hypothetical protein
MKMGRATDSRMTLNTRIDSTMDNRKDGSPRSHGTGEQMPLFTSCEPKGEPEIRKRQIAVNPRSPTVNPHLQAARRLSRKIRRLPDHSLEQTQAGLAIFQHLRALLRDASEQPPQH